MAKKKETEPLAEALQSQTEAGAQAGDPTEGQNSRTDVENAMAGAPRKW